MLKRLSDNMAIYLNKNLINDTSKTEIYSYGLQIFIGTLLEILSIILASCIFNILKPTSIVLFSFVLFRRIIGGTHCKTYINCFWISSVSIFTLGFIGAHITISDWKPIIIIPIYIITIIYTIIFIPMGTENKSIKNPETRMRIKIKTIFMLSIWTGFVFHLKDSPISGYIFPSLLGIAGAFFFSTPFSYRLIDTLDSYSTVKRGGSI